MNWKNKYKRKRQRKKIFSRVRFLNIKKRIYSYLHLLLWGFIILILYSIIKYNFGNLLDNNNSRELNQKQIKELNLPELYKLKNLDHNNVRIWILNNTNQTGLAAKIRDCLEKGYYIGKEHIKGDYNVLKQDNFN